MTAGNKFTAGPAVVLANFLRAGRTTLYPILVQPACVLLDLAYIGFVDGQESTIYHTLLPVGRRQLWIIISSQICCLPCHQHPKIVLATAYYNCFGEGFHGIPPHSCSSAILMGTLCCLPPCSLSSSLCPPFISCIFLPSPSYSISFFLTHFSYGRYGLHAMLAICLFA